MNPELKHKHGSALRPPSSKGELIRHLEVGHGALKLDPIRWTRVALDETHRTWHVGWNVEGLEQAVAQ